MEEEQRKKEDLEKQQKMRAKVMQVAEQRRIKRRGKYVSKTCYTAESYRMLDTKSGVIRPKKFFKVTKDTPDRFAKPMKQSKSMPFCFVEIQTQFNNML